ncbi:hypothetical protein [Herbidospora cretacea]|uniref:hypothetical protein n=1 Tax=Herbidospora cretacea TaxID=28444 RepID=UPI000774100D|nr:hypothetical protein [Herbidospora cretacea]
MSAYMLIRADKGGEFLVMAVTPGPTLLAGRIEPRGDQWAILHVSDAVWGLTANPLVDLDRFVDQFIAEIPAEFKDATREA